MDAIDNMDATDNWVEMPQVGSFTYKKCSYFYQRWGDPERPPLVLLHGFMQSSTSWEPIAASLKLHFCVYAVDFIGHGLSDKSKNPARYTYEDMAASIDYFLRKVVCRPSDSASKPSNLANKISRRVASKPSKRMSPLLKSLRKSSGDCAGEQSIRAHVVGYSMGGRIALALMKTSCDVLASVILESCNLGCATDEEQQEAAKRNSAWVNRIREEGMEEFVNYWETLPLFETQKELGFDKILHFSRAANDPECMALCLEGAGKQAMPLSSETLASIEKAIAFQRDETCSQTVAPKQDETRFREIAPQQDVRFQAATPKRDETRSQANDSEADSRKGIPVLYIYGDKDKKSTLVAQKLSAVGASVSAINVGHNVHLEAPMLYLREMQNFLVGIDQTLWD